MIRLKTLITEQSEQNVDNLKQAAVIVNGLESRGFNQTEAIALAGNMSVESYSNGKWFTPSATDGQAVGIMQWQGARLDALKAFAKYHGKSYTSLGTQLDFVKFELKDGYLLHPEDATKPAKEQLIPGIPINLVYVVNSERKPTKPRQFTAASTEAKTFKSSIKGSIADTTKSLTVNIFRPSVPHTDRRVANAIAIQNYINKKTIPAGEQPTPTKSSGKTYTIKSGETLGGIANRNKTTVDAILKKNPGLNPDKIKVGQTIQL